MEETKLASGLLKTDLKTEIRLWASALQD